MRGRYVERIRSIEVAQHTGEVVLVAGWLHALRQLGSVSFLILRDGWGTMQAVIESEEALASLRASGAGAESVLRVRGRVTRSERAPGGVELREPEITVVEAVREPPPVALGKRELKASVPTLLDTAAVTNRHPTRRAVLRLGAGVIEGFRRCLIAKDYTEIQSPKLVGAATESGANVFSLDYFGQTAYLAQSPQLYKQIMVAAFERVFEVGPVFRAEPHDTTRHMNEYVSLDAELGFIEDHFTVMRELRDVIASILETLSEDYAAELTLLGARMPEVAGEIPWIHFTEAQELILTLHGVDVRGEPDLSPQDERWLGEWAATTHGSDFLYVTGYPTAKRAFYTHPEPGRPEFSNSFDLIFRGTELVSGGQRLHRYADYVATLTERGLPTEPFADYLQAFKYGMPPEGGFAIGQERLLMQLLGLPTLKLAALFPRDLHRLTP
ncbi:MAG TPA: aspartate--tRNA(Asn) ligase [Ktedonobacterales bacterium]